MIADYARLGLRKDRLLFCGLAAAFALSLPLAAGTGSLVGYGAQRSLDAAFLFWTALGFPVMSVLSGAAAGVGLRETEAAEQPLPLSPRRRVGGAFLASFCALAGVGALVAAAAWLLSPGWRSVLGDATLPLLVPYVRLCAVMSAYLFACAFACAYCVGHGAAGGLIVLILGFLPVAASTLGLAAWEVYGPRAPFWAGFAAAWLAAMALVCAATLMLAGAVERRAPLKARAPALAFLLIGPPLFLAGPLRGARVLLRTPELARLEPVVRSLEGRKLVERLRPYSGGLLLETPTGAQVWLGLDGRTSTVLAPRRDRGLVEVIDNMYFDLEESTTWDDEGRLWVARADPRARRVDVWSGRPPEPLALAGSVAAPNAVLAVRRGGGVEVLVRERGWRAASMEPGRPLRWRELGELESLPPTDALGDLPTVDGTSWRWRGDGVDLRSPGRAPVRSPAKPLRGHGWATLVRRHGGSLWIVDHAVLYRLSERTGKLEASWPTGRVEPSLAFFSTSEAIAEGVVTRMADGLLFTDWEGRQRRLR